MDESSRRRFVFGPCLGRGGFGEVYQARMISPGGLETTVAVKVLRAELGDPDAVGRLRDEGRLLARLNHPTILKVYDLMRIDGQVAMIAEYVDGADLAAITGPDLSIRAVLQVIGGVASALHAAWSTPGPTGAPLELVHRDIKPTNIRVGRHGEIKLLDFGIAHFQGHEREAKTASDVIVGSLPYMAPERFLEREVRTSSDVFALGCTLYEALVGERFFGEGQLRRIGGLALDRDLYDAFLADRLAKLPAHVPEPVAELLVELLAHDHGARPRPDALAARCDALADAIGGLPLRAWCRDRRWSEAPVQDGPLVGRSVTEGTLDLTGARSEPASGAMGVGPRLRRAPSETIDPTALPAGLPSGGYDLVGAGVGEPVGARRSAGSRTWFALVGCGGVGLAILLLVSAIVVAFAAVAMFSVT